MGPRERGDDTGGARAAPRQVKNTPQGSAANLGAMSLRTKGSALFTGEGERRSGEARNEGAPEIGGGVAPLARAAERLGDTLNKLGIGPGELGPERRFQPWPE